MKKKKMDLNPKLFLQKQAIAALNKDQSNVILGGATEYNDPAVSGGTCGPCNTVTRQYSRCHTVNNANGVCCSVINTGINGPC